MHGHDSQVILTSNTGNGYDYCMQVIVTFIVIFIVIDCNIDIKCTTTTKKKRAAEFKFISRNHT